MQEIVFVDSQKGLLSSRGGGGADILAPGLQDLTEPLKANDGVKNCGEWEQFGVGGKNVCSNVLRSLAKCCIPSRNFAFSLKKNVRSFTKIFAFSRKTS